MTNDELNYFQPGEIPVQDKAKYPLQSQGDSTRRDTGAGQGEIPPAIVF